MRAGAAAPDRIAAAAEAPDVLAVAFALRWERPDLTGQLADHVLGVAEAAGDRDHWLLAAGWAVHARSAVGDGRPVASTALEGVRRWGAAALTVPAAYRLRIELALVAIGTGQPDRARALLEPVVAAASSPLLRADARTALARCAMEDASREVMSELRNAHAAWSEVQGRDANLGLAATELVAAAAHRRAGRPDASAAAATAGLSRLRGRPVNGSTGTPSGYLSAALTTEWISALLDTGRVDEAQDGCEPLFGWLGESPRPCRQLARLRLTVARAVASGTAPEVTAEALAKAAQDAADSDAPDLEVVSRSALGALLQQLGRADEANAAILLAAQAERRDKHRGQLFRAVLGAATVPGSDVLVAGPSSGSGVADDNGNIRGDRPDPRRRLPARGPRVAGIDAIAAQGLGLRETLPAPPVDGGTGALAQPPDPPSGPVGRRPVDPTGTAPRSGRFGCGAPAERPTAAAGATFGGSCSATTLDESVAVGRCGGRATREQGAGDHVEPSRRSRRSRRFACPGPGCLRSGRRGQWGCTGGHRGVLATAAVRCRGTGRYR